MFCPLTIDNNYNDIETNDSNLNTSNAITITKGQRNFII